LVDPVDTRHTNDERIAWVLAHPGMSPWLKAALKGATGCPPVEVQNDLEILNLLLCTYVAEGLAAKEGDSDLMRGEFRAE
jgi:hypothetical protein